MTRRRRDHTPIPSPLIGQGFTPQQAAKAVIQVIREVHAGNYDVEPQDMEEALREAIEKARRERGKGGEI